MSFKVIFFCLITLTLYGQSEEDSGPVNKRIINAVVEVQSGKNAGSGFLVFVGQRQFLITNKHVVGEWSPVDSLLWRDSLYFYPYSTVGKAYSFMRVGVKISEKGIPIQKKVKTHKNFKVDIAIVDITSETNKLSLEHTTFVDTAFLLPLEKAKKFITYGSQVFTIGYPSGLKAFRTNLPLVKSGHIASSVEGDLTMEQIWVNRKGKNIKTLTEGRIFIVDGLIIPGNSGGPVVSSQEISWREINGQQKYLRNAANYFIGIVSNMYNNTGLTIVFSSDNILEVLRQFK